MRADRLIALLLFLQSSGRVTAADVAAELEVSLATARRDLDALSSAGIPVYVQPGRGGGWQLVGGARTNLSGLSGHESKALFWMLGTAGLGSAETRVATMKLIRALPASLREEAERLATSIHYDHRPWGELSSPVTGGLDMLREAVVQRRVIEASYTSRGGGESALSLKPLGLVAKAGVWYLIADGPNGLRTYRTTRLADSRITDESFEPPADFDLAEFWKGHTEEIESMRSGVSAKIAVAHWMVPILQKQFGRYFTILSGGEEDSAIVEVRAHLLVGLAEQLAGWGDKITVIEPAELRAELHRIGTELIAANDDGIPAKATD